MLELLIKIKAIVDNRKLKAEFHDFKIKSEQEKVKLKKEVKFICSSNFR